MNINKTEENNKKITSINSSPSKNNINPLSTHLKYGLSQRVIEKSIEETDITFRTFSCMGPREEILKYLTHREIRNLRSVCLQFFYCFPKKNVLI